MKKLRHHQRRKHGRKPKGVFKPPESEKVVHHVVPQSWQKKFAPPTDPKKPYYENILTGRKTKPEGPGRKMAVEWANTTFTPKGFPLDQLENRLAKEENRLMPVVERVLATGRIDPADRGELARFLALQICRDPEHFDRRLGLGQLLALDLLDIGDYDDLAAFHARLRLNPRYAHVTLLQEEFDHLRKLPAGQLECAVELLLNAALREEEGLNPNSVIDAATPLAATLEGFGWRLLHAPEPSFIQSDRPVPMSITGPFAVGLGADYALRIDPGSRDGGGTLVAAPATSAEIVAINAEVAGRAREWICGPKPF